MNSSGISRRVDELGRIVIPIEIRRLLSIKDGENLEFSVDNGALILKKINIIDNNLVIINNISNSLEKVMDGEFIVTDRDKVIAASNKDLIGEILDGPLINAMSNNDETVINESIFGMYKYFYIFPYYISSNISGLIVLYDIDDVNKYKKLVRFLSNYINDVLSLSWKIDFYMLKSS